LAPLGGDEGDDAEHDGRADDDLAAKFGLFHLKPAPCVPDEVTDAVAGVVPERDDGEEEDEIAQETCDPAIWCGEAVRTARRAHEPAHDHAGSDQQAATRDAVHDREHRGHLWTVDFEVGG